MQYSFPYCLLFFFIYCFLGWCIESAIVSVSSGKLTNRGFLRGPYLPIYGFGAILIIFSTLRVADNLIAAYFVGMVVCSALEYVTGVLMEVIFKTKYWDYTGCFMNFRGRICLKSSLFWGVLTLLVIKVIHTPIAEFIFYKVSFRAVLTCDIVFCAAMLCDLYFSAKAAFSLGEIASKLEEINVQLELAKMEARDALSIKAEELELRMDERTGRLTKVNADLLGRINDLRTAREEVLKKATFSVRSLVKSNPNASHKRFARGYKELKEYITKKETNNKRGGRL